MAWNVKHFWMSKRDSLRDGRIEWSVNKACVGFNQNHNLTGHHTRHGTMFVWPKYNSVNSACNNTQQVTDERNGLDEQDAMERK